MKEKRLPFDYPLCYYFFPIDAQLHHIKATGIHPQIMQIVYFEKSQSRKKKILPPTKTRSLRVQLQFKRIRRCFSGMFNVRKKNQNINRI